MRASRIGIAAGLVTLLIAGCSPSALPAGLGEEEVEAIQDQEARAWWSAIAPGEPMPAIDVIEYTYDGGPDHIRACVDAADVDGMRVRDDGSIEFDTADAMNEHERATFRCMQAYPYRGSGTAESMGLYSDAQIDVLTEYFDTRLVPCLEALGYLVAARPAHLEGPYVSWTPYYNLSPQPTDEDWRFIDVRCPPTPLGEFFRPGDW